MWHRSEQHEREPKHFLKTCYVLGGFQEALQQNPRDMSQGRIFSEMIRVSAQKSELQAKSQSYRPKVRVTAWETPIFFAHGSGPLHPIRLGHSSLGGSTSPIASCMAAASPAAGGSGNPCFSDRPTWGTH